MPNYSSFISANGYAIDIQGAKAAAGTPLDAFTPTGHSNQLWALQEVPFSPYFYIVSALQDKHGHTLVINISGDKTPKAGTKLDIAKQDNNSRQLWYFAPVLNTPGSPSGLGGGGVPVPGSFFASALTDVLGNDLVINITGRAEHPRPGAAHIDVWTVDGRDGQNWSYQGSVPNQ